MKKIGLLVLGFFFLGSMAQAKALKFEDQYELFDGGKVSLVSQNQKPIYLKFWASWCLDCRKELPSLEQTYLRYKDKIDMFAVNLNINETTEDIAKLKQKNHLTIPIVMDNNGSIASNFEFVGTPFHVLIDSVGKVVYTTYKDDANLQIQLEALSKNKSMSESAHATADDVGIKQALTKGFSLVYFTASWCDWYMKDIHPEMSSNCLKATELINDLYRDNSRLSLQAYVTHLWTSEQDLSEYVKKFSIGYKVKIDQNNELARFYKVNQYPTLILMIDGKEIKRFSRFEDAKAIRSDIKNINSKM